MTIAESLHAISGYPIPFPLVANALEEEGLVPDMEATPDIRNSAEYKRCKAAVYLFLATAPNVSQGGVSYSFTDADKTIFRSKARALLDEVGATEGAEVQYGYQGDNY